MKDRSSLLSSDSNVKTSLLSAYCVSPGMSHLQISFTALKQDNLRKK